MQLHLGTLINPYLSELYTYCNFFEVNLLSIRFSYVFVRFFTFLLLLEKYALFHPHFCKSIYALSRLLYIDEILFKILCMNDKSDISK